MKRTSRFWSCHDVSYRRWSLSNSVSHGHANRIILIRFKILEHVVIRVLRCWYILSIDYETVLIELSMYLSLSIPRWTMYNWYANRKRNAMPETYFVSTLVLTS